MVKPGVLLFWESDGWFDMWYDSDITTGKGGVGAYNTPAGNSISDVRIGPLDRVAPGAAIRQSIGVASFPNRIEMQWAGATDDASGVGPAYYYIWRDGAGYASPPSASYVDDAVSPGESHTYTIAAVDRHYNVGGSAATTIQVAPANTTVPRRVGVRSTGTYWGGAGEQIDLLSGNLNYTVPLITAKSRGGWSAGFSLNYNSQMWRQDLGGTWKLGRDVGYGLGWKLLAGSITPIYSGTWALHHYVFMDSTGAEYRLEINNGNVWTSHEGFYGSFDANTSTLYFPDGSYWRMWVTSGGDEEDAGTVYPAYFYDTNGNYIQLDYAASAGSGLGASSARLTRIWDSRVWYMSVPIYTFTYNTDTIPHLTGIQCAVTQAESYSFGYQGNQSLYSPFDQTPFGTATLLQSVGTTGLGPTTTFQYASSGEMTQMTTPMGGSLLWHYRTYTYSGTRRYREVDSRQVTASSTCWAW